MSVSRGCGVPLKSWTACRTALWAAVGAVALLTGFAAGIGGVARAGGVTIEDGSTDGSNTFTPNVVTISVGDSVTFTWVDGAHDARDAQSGAIYLPLSTGPNSKTTTFGTPGTYYFFCSIHAKATDATDANIASNTRQVGKIIVLGAPVPTPVATAAPTTTAPPPTGTTSAPATPPANPGAQPSSSSPATAIAQAPSVTATPAGVPFEAAISVSIAPAGPATGAGLTEEASSDPLPRWLEAVAIFGVIAAVALTIMVRSIRKV
jgi:plastocyanin